MLSILMIILRCVVAFVMPNLSHEPMINLPLEAQNASSLTSLLKERLESL